MSFPWSGEANQGQERLGGKRMVHCAADSTSAKSILYGGNEPAPHATQGGKKMLDAHRGRADAPFATDVVIEAPSTRGNLDRMKHLGDKGNKFSVGADKVGKSSQPEATPEQTLDFYNTRANYSEAKIRNARGAGNILAHDDH